MSYYLICYEVLNVSFLLKFMPKYYHQYAIRKDVFVLHSLLGGISE